MGYHLPDALPSLLKLPIMFSFATTDIGLCSQKDLLLRMSKEKKKARQRVSLCCPTGRHNNELFAEAVGSDPPMAHWKELQL